MEEIIETIIYENTNEYFYLKIKTNKQEIFFGISNDRLCCETYGIKILFNEQKIDNNNKDFNKDDLKYFIGFIINKIIILPDSEYNDYYGDINIQLQTNNGNITICLYNEHNGYYPHDYKISYNNNLYF